MGGRGGVGVESRGGGEKEQGAGAVAAGGSPELTQVVLHCFSSFKAFRDLKLSATRKGGNQSQREHFPFV